MISTHTPLAGRDTVFQFAPNLRLVFQLTRPLRGVTYSEGYEKNYGKISTHTPLAGRDGVGVCCIIPFADFNSHAPCGA